MYIQFFFLLLCLVRSFYRHTTDTPPQPRCVSFATPFLSLSPCLSLSLHLSLSLCLSLSLHLPPSYPPSPPKWYHSWLYIARSTYKHGHPSLLLPPPPPFLSLINFICGQPVALAQQTVVQGQAIQLLIRVPDKSFLFLFSPLFCLG